MATKNGRRKIIPLLFWCCCWIPIRIIWEAGSAADQGEKPDPQESQMTMAVGRLKMEPWKVFRPLIVDLHHYDEEQHPYTHQNGESDPDPQHMLGVV